MQNKSLQNERNSLSSTRSIPSETEASPTIAASCTGGWGALSRLDWPILLFTAWICARTFWFCEPLGQSCDYLWGIVALFGSAVWFLLLKPKGTQTPAAQAPAAQAPAAQAPAAQASRFQQTTKSPGKPGSYTWFQFTWLDAMVGTFFLIYIISDIVAMGTGNQRATFNALWSGVFWGLAYGLTRLIVNSDCRRRILISSLVLISVVLAVWGLYQYYYEYPLERERYMSNPEKTLYESGIWYEKGSANRKLFEDRFFAQEPTASFALSNTLGAFLVPGFLLLAAGCSVLVSGVGKTDRLATHFQWDKSRSDRNVGACRSRESRYFLFKIRWTDWFRICFAPTVCCLIILTAIALTGSRSAALAITFVVAAAGLIWFWNQFVNKRNALLALLGLIIVGALGAGFVLARFPRILDVALLSVEYRLQYWDATLDMIADHPLIGIGAGNFQERYTGYMSAESGESISDPHNFLLEIAVLTGVPGAILFWAFLGGVCWRIWQTLSNASGSNKPGGDEIALRSVDSDGSLCSNVVGSALISVFWGLLIGFFMGLIAAGRNPGPIVVLLLTAVLAGYWLRNLFEALPTSPQAVAVAAGGLLIALLASGGIAYTTTAVLFWVLCALAASPGSGSELNQEGELSERSSDSWVLFNVPLSKTLVFLPLSLLAVCYITGYYPTTEAASRLRQAWYATNSDDQLSFLQQAVELDPLDCWTHSALASYGIEKWLETVKRQGKTDESAESFWSCFEKQSILAIERNSRNSILWLENGKGYWKRYQQTHSEEDLVAASQAFQNSCRLFPVDLTSKAWLSLSMASQALTKNSFKTVQEYARDVLKASDETAHHNRKIPESLRKEVQKLVDIDIEREYLRERSHSNPLKEEKE